MLLVYVPRQTPRQQYALNLIFRHILKLEYEVTTDAEAFRVAERPRLSYGEKPLDDELFIHRTPLLMEKRVQKQAFKVTTWEDIPVFYRTPVPSALPFDPFAAAFYLVSRYEEYLPFQADRHGRFPATESVAYKHHFLERPVVNEWALKLEEKLKAKYPRLETSDRHYSYIPTYDIDSAFAYRFKGLLRMMGGYYQAVARGDWHAIKRRTRVLLGLHPDPYNNFNRILAMHHQTELPAIFFFLLGEYGEYDKNISFRINAFQNIIKLVSDHAEVGTHPSYASHHKPDLLHREIARLGHIIKREVHKSRQHYLLLTFPETYQRLIGAEVTDDYTMGYADRPGFRAGIATPFPFYDLELEAPTRLMIHPFMAMDVTLRRYLGLSRQEALQRVRSLADRTRAVQGQFITLWHNESLSRIQGWEGWRETYEEILEAASPKKTRTARTKT